MKETTSETSNNHAIEWAQTIINAPTHLFNRHFNNTPYPNILMIIDGLENDTDGNEICRQAAQRLRNFLGENEES